ADVALDFAALLSDVVPEAGARARVGREQPAHQPDRGGLAAAVGSEEAEDFAPVHAQRHFIDDVLVAEVLVQAADIDGSLLIHLRVTATGCPGRSFGAFSTE